ncbi:acyltransferase family protein [Streptomyces sp. NPDC096198]|uniref:acyltransferase family protein n=1 Tax=Streptomyces sp. NPDC096198 TaxID=3366080 RepID=UPI003800BFE3
MFPAASSSPTATGPADTPLPPVRSPTDTVPHPRAPGPAAPPAKQRDAFFDNAKYLAIVLVALGHAWEPLKEGSRVLQAAYLCIYAFHMPAFIIISGYFSRSFDLRPDRLKRLVTGVVVPYIVFETAYALFQRIVDRGPAVPISLLDPWYLMWFLAALFVWRMITPLVKLVRYPLALAVALSMLASVSPEIGDDLDLQRVFQFLPFFVLGLSLKQEHFALVRRRSVRILSVPVFAAAFAVAWWASPRMNSGWFCRCDSAQELGAPWWTGPVMTLALLGCSLALTACFYAWVPGRTTWFTALGASTLYGYLLHGFLVKGAGYQGWYDAAWLHRPWGEAVVALLAAAVVTLLCTPPVRRVFRCVVEPRMDWAFRKDAVAAARERARA